MIPCTTVSLTDIWHNGYPWESDRELYDTIMQYNAFYTEAEFIDHMLERIAELKEDEEDPAEVIHSWTYDGEMTDTKVYKTEDGYVIRVWY